MGLVVDGRHRPRGLDHEPQVRAGHGREGDRDLLRGAVLGPVGDGRDRELAHGHAVGLEAQLGRHRVAAVGDHGEGQVVDGLGRGQVGLDPLALLGPDGRAPCRRRVAVERA